MITASTTKPKKITGPNFIIPLSLSSRYNAVEENSIKNHSCSGGFPSSIHFLAKNNASL
jgi:hypothetical protein